MSANYFDLARELAAVQRDGFLELHGVSAEQIALIQGLDKIHALLQIGLECDQDDRDRDRLGLPPASPDNRIEFCRNCGQSLARCQCDPLPLDEAGWRRGPHNSEEAGA